MARDMTNLLFLLKTNCLFSLAKKQVSIQYSMTEENNRIKQAFFTWRLVPFQVEKPITNQIITINQMSPLPEPKQLPEDILSKMGVLETDKKVSNSFFDFKQIFSCTACKALSRQTLNQIRQNQPDLEKESRAHLSDKQKKQKFEQIWKNYSERTVKKQQLTFQQAYKKYGHVGQDEWREEIKKLFK